MNRTATVLAWLPAIVCMAAIRIAVSLPAETRASALQSGGRLSDAPGALAHVVLYGVLALAYLLALRKGGGALGRRWALPGAFLLATAYATFDEYHQTTMPAHGGWPDDIGWDALGALLALAAPTLRGPLAYARRAAAAPKPRAADLTPAPLLPRRRPPPAPSAFRRTAAAPPPSPSGGRRRGG